MAVLTTGDISNRTAAYAARDFLKRGLPYLVFEKFGETHVLPERSTKTIIFRRYNALPSTPKVLTEGVTPVSSNVDITDVPCTLVELGDRVVISNVVMDTNEDPVLQENITLLGEQGAEMVEEYRYNILKAGTNVWYGNGYSRSDVNQPISLGIQRGIVAGFKTQKARKITNVVRSSPSYGTVNVAPSYIAVAHPNLQPDIEKLEGFKAAEDYGQISPYENEIGKVGEVRYLTSTVIKPFYGAGASKASEGPEIMVDDDGKADIYPILYLAARAYALVPLKGKFAISPMVVNPKPRDSDPLAQRGHVGWKTMQGCVITNDMWMCRAEVACRAFD